MAPKSINDGRFSESLHVDFHKAVGCSVFKIGRWGVEIKPSTGVPGMGPIRVQCRGPSGLRFFCALPDDTDRYTITAMAYDKIQQSAEYENKKTQLSGHNIPLETIKEVVDNPTREETQKRGRKAYWGQPEGYPKPIRVVVSAINSAGNAIYRIVTAFKDSK